MKSARVIARGSTEGTIHISLETRAAEGFGRVADMAADTSASCEATQVRSDDDPGVLADDSRAGSVDTRASNRSDQTSSSLEPGKKSQSTFW
jgi:hypothetical protein